MATTKTTRPDRRAFLAGAAGLSAATLIPGVILITATPGAAAVDGGKRWGLLIDTRKCDAGCTECVGACRTENGWQGQGRVETDAQWIRKIDLTDKMTGATKSLPAMCQHCDTPPCVDVCPTGASFKRADGIVLVDKHICIGCRYCMMACPYKARSFLHEPASDQKPHAPRGMGTVEACTLCAHRIDDGNVPACVEACVEKAGRGAMVFGDLKNPQSTISQAVGKATVTRIRDDLGLNQGVLYQGF